MVHKLIFYHYFQDTVATVFQPDVSTVSGGSGGPTKCARPPKLARKLFPSSDSSSQFDEDPWKPDCSDTGTNESLEFKSTQETPQSNITESAPSAPIARLESLDELETSQSQVRTFYDIQPF